MENREKIEGESPPMVAATATEPTEKEDSTNLSLDTTNPTATTNEAATTTTTTNDNATSAAATTATTSTLGNNNNNNHKTAPKSPAMVEMEAKLQQGLSWVKDKASHMVPPKTDNKDSTTTPRAGKPQAVVDMEDKFKKGFSWMKDKASAVTAAPKTTLKPKEQGTATDASDEATDTTCTDGPTTTKPKSPTMADMEQSFKQSLSWMKDKASSVVPKPKPTVVTTTTSDGSEQEGTSPTTSTTTSTTTSPNGVKTPTVVVEMEETFKKGLSWMKVKASSVVPQQSKKSTANTTTESTSDEGEQQDSNDPTATTPTTSSSGKTPTMADMEAKFKQGFSWMKDKASSVVPPQAKKSTTTPTTTTTPTSSSTTTTGGKHLAEMEATLQKGFSWMKDKTSSVVGNPNSQQQQQQLAQAISKRQDPFDNKTHNTHPSNLAMQLTE